MPLKLTRLCGRVLLALGPAFLSAASARSLTAVRSADDQS